MKIIFKIIATLLFLIALIFHLFIPSITIDTITIILLILMFIPWTLDYIKVLEISGLGKVEIINEKEKKIIQEKAHKVGVLEETTVAENEYSFTRYMQSDPKLALAGLRMELENLLSIIAEENGILNRNFGIGKLTTVLLNNNLISNDESVLISDISGVLNRAIHNKIDEKDLSSVKWVFDLSLNLLNELNKRSQSTTYNHVR